MMNTSDMERIFPHGLLHPELFLGIVSSISARSIGVNLNDAGLASGSHFSGTRYGKGEVGEFVLVEGQQCLLLGRIREIFLREPERKMIRPGFVDVHDLEAIAQVQLLGTVSMDNLQVTAGIQAYPRLGDRIYSAPNRFIALVPSLMENSNNPKSVVFDIGYLNSLNDCRVTVTPEKLFGRHCAILGATGGGKSWTTARIIEQCLKYKSKMILLDATGEYRKISGDYIAHYHLGNPVEVAVDSQECSLPPTSFSETDFLALFEPSGKVQGPKLRAAIRSLKLAKICEHLAHDGVILKINRPKSPIIEAEMNPNISAKLDDPRQEFDVSKLVRQIEEECVCPEGYRGREKDPTIWGGEDGNFTHCLPLVSRINGVLTSHAFRCIFNPPKESTEITKAIDLFISSDIRLFRIDMSGVGYEYKAREIIANAIGRYVLNKARNKDLVSNPIVIIVDEAHNYIGRFIGSEDNISKLDAFEIIAKEGRKYGLNICLATQRPRDVTEGVLSQIGTLIVHRLTNDRDLEVIERSCGEIDKAATVFLPNLRQGQAALIGVDFPIPLTIQIAWPSVPPLSDGPDYQKEWGQTSSDKAK